MRPFLAELPAKGERLAGLAHLTHVSLGNVAAPVLMDRPEGDHGPHEDQDHEKIFQGCKTLSEHVLADSHQSSSSL
jgi:hypothetical protein